MKKAFNGLQMAIWKKFTETLFDGTSMAISSDEVVDNLQIMFGQIHGGNAINQNPQKGVVDMHQKVHGTANVYVTDASVMPSSIRVNAQLTTMAMADRVTHGQRIFDH
jgi:hypothetical protein